MALKTVIASGNWSNPNIWSPSPPQDGDDVLHPAGYTVYLDTDTPQLGNYELRGTLLIPIPTNTSQRRLFRATSGLFLGSIDAFISSADDVEFGFVEFQGLGSSPLDFTSLSNFFSFWSEVFPVTKHGRFWLQSPTSWMLQVSSVSKVANTVIIQVSTVSGSAGAAFLSASQGATRSFLCPMTFTDSRGGSRRLLLVPIQGSVLSNNISTTSISDHTRVVVGAYLIPIEHFKLSPLIFRNCKVKAVTKGCVITDNSEGEVTNSVLASGKGSGDELLLTLPIDTDVYLSVGRAYLALNSCTNESTVRGSKLRLDAVEVATVFSSDLPALCTAQSLTAPGVGGKPVCLFRNSLWSLPSFSGDLLVDGGSGSVFTSGCRVLNTWAGGDGLSLVVSGGSFETNFSDFISSAPSNPTANYTLQFINCGDVKRGVVTNRASLRVGGTVTFLGETLEKVEVTLTNPASDGTAFIPLSSDPGASYCGLGVVSQPSGGEIGLIGLDGVYTKNTGVWLVAPAQGNAVLWLKGAAGDQWTCANLRFWGDGELPCFAIQVSDQESSKVFKFLLAPVNDTETPVWKVKLPNVAAVAFRYQAGGGGKASLIDAGIIRAVLDQDTWKWAAFTPISDTFTFLFNTFGSFSLDVAALQGDYYPNFRRVSSLLSILPIVKEVLPDPSLLPKEGYIAALNGSLTDLQGQYPRFLFIQRGLLRDGVSLRATLHWRFSLPRFIDMLLSEQLSYLTPVSVYLQGNTLYVWVVCGRDENEAQVLGNALRFARAALTFLAQIDPSLEGITPKVRALHRV